MDEFRRVSQKDLSTEMYQSDFLPQKITLKLRYAKKVLLPGRVTFVRTYTRQLK